MLSVSSFFSKTTLSEDFVRFFVNIENVFHILRIIRIGALIVNQIFNWK